MRTLSAFLLSLSAVLPAGAAGQGLEASFGEAGLSGLRYGGHDFLKSGAPEGMIVFLETVGKDKDGYRSWSFEKAEGAPSGVRFDKAKRLLVQTYSWGTLSVAYAPVADRLTMDVTLAVGLDQLVIVKAEGEKGEAALRLQGGVLAEEYGACLWHPHEGLRGTLEVVQ